jgi:hypothetical protein
LKGCCLIVCLSFLSLSISLSLSPLSLFHSLSPFLSLYVHIYVSIFMSHSLSRLSLNLYRDAAAPLGTLLLKTDPEPEERSEESKTSPSYLEIILGGITHVAGVDRSSVDSEEMLR